MIEWHAVFDAHWRSGSGRLSQLDMSSHWRPYASRLPAHRVAVQFVVAGDRYIHATPYERGRKRWPPARHPGHIRQYQDWLRIPADHRIIHSGELAGNNVPVEAQAGAGQHIEGERIPAAVIRFRYLAAGKQHVPVSLYIRGQQGVRFAATVHRDVAMTGTEMFKGIGS